MIPLAPAGAVPRWSPARTPSLWILGIVTVLSTLGSVALVVVSAIAAPTAAAVTLVMVTILGVVWVATLLRFGDIVERRPVWLVTAALLWGGTVAVAVGGGAGYFLDLLIAKVVSPTFAAQWGAALTAPYAEELGKAAGVVALLLAARPFLITVWSGALHGALVGVGFALVEDFGYATGEADAVLPDDVGAAAGILVLRALVPGLVGHPLFTATVGAGIAYAWLRRDRSRRRRIGVLIGALSGGVGMHAAVNSPVAAAAADALGPMPYANYLAGYLFVVCMVALPWVWWLAGVRRADARLLLERAAAVAPDVIRPTEIATLAGVRARSAAVRQLRRTNGAEAARRLRRLQRAQLGLAAALARPYRGWPPIGPFGAVPPVLRCWQEAVDARAGLPAAAPQPTTPAAPPAVPPATAPAAAPPATAPAVPAAAPPAVPGAVPAAAPSGRAGWRSRAAAGAVLLSAVVGVVVWPVAPLALAAALPLARRGDRSRPARVAVAVAGFGTYCALATVIIDHL